VSGAPDDNRSLEWIHQTSRIRRLDIDGQLWVVHEVPAPPFDRRGGTHLIFETHDVMRRVRLFPDDWLTLSDEDLYALSLAIRLE
jgi:hypothetical protein